MDNQTKGGWKDITNKIKTEIIGEQKTETITNGTKQHNLETWHQKNIHEQTKQNGSIYHF